MYGGGPAQRGFGPPMPGWRPQMFQYPGQPAAPAPRPVLAAPARPVADTASIQRPTITEQSAAGQPGMQFVPTQVNSSLCTHAHPLHWSFSRFIWCFTAGNPP